MRIRSGLYSVRNFFERLAEVADKAAADAARVHLGHLDARVLQKARVNADFAELVFDDDELLTGVGLFYELLDERGLTRAEEA